MAFASTPGRLSTHCRFNAVHTYHYIHHVGQALESLLRGNIHRPASKPRSTLIHPKRLAIQLISEEEAGIDNNLPSSSRWGYVITSGPSGLSACDYTFVAVGYLCLEHLRAMNSTSLDDLCQPLQVCWNKTLIITCIYPFRQSLKIHGKYHRKAAIAYHR